MYLSRFQRLAGGSLLISLISLPFQQALAQDAGGSMSGGGLSGVLGNSLGGNSSGGSGATGTVMPGSLGSAVSGNLPNATGLPAILGNRGVDVLQSAPTPDQLKASMDAQKAAGLPDAAANANETKAQPTDFQLFAATSVGSVLPVFGRNLFSGAPSTFAPVDDLPASSDYMINTGDEILIRGWGQVDIDVRAIVSREGTINIPRVGMVNVAGIRYQDLPAYIKNAIGRYYRNFELSVSLGKLRSIQVFVVGQANKPGLYTISSLSTLMNALFSSGGPSPTGSMRKIQLRRGDKLVGEFDLYDILLKGDKSRDLRLQSGDVIFIPPVGPVAAIAGGVKTPAIFELKGKDSSVGELLEYAGGLTTTASNQKILLESIAQEKGRQIKELAFEDKNLAYHLKDGDIVKVGSLSLKFGNDVTLRGNVAFPMRTEWHKGMRISDLIPNKDALITEAFWRKTASRAFQPTLEQGAVKHDIENLVDEVNWDYAVIERLDRNTLQPRLIPFNLGKAVVDRDPADDLPLLPGDVVSIFSKSDILTPADRRTIFVRLEGEVATPGVYQVRPGETLRQLLAKVGGFTRNAYLFGAEFDRESVRKEQQERLSEVIARAEQDLESSVNERMSRVVSADDSATIKTQIDNQRRSLDKLRQLKSSGRIVLEVSPEADAVKDLPDLVLEDGDRLIVPMRPSTVGVYGAVYNQSSFIYKPGKRVEDYLSQAGGPTKQADSGSLYVLRADGSVMSNRQAGWFSSLHSKELMPNDSVVMPEDYVKISWIKELKDWSQIFYQFGLGVSAIKILKN